MATRCCTHYLHSYNVEAISMCEILVTGICEAQLCQIWNGLAALILVKDQCNYFDIIILILFIIKINVTSLFGCLMYSFVTS